MKISFEKLNAKTQMGKDAEGKVRKSYPLVKPVLSLSRNSFPVGQDISRL
jgi:hypothetical protein